MSGPLAGQSIEVAGEIVIGRENVDLAIDDAEISRRHVAVRRLSRAFEVEDLGSSNGTFVDGQRIESPTRVGGGAQIRLGGTVLQVEGVLPLDATRLQDIGEVHATGAGAPQVTRVGAERAEPLVDPEATRARNIPSKVAEGARATPTQADSTSSAPGHSAEGARVAEPLPPISSQPPAGAPGGAALREPSSSLPVGTFSPPTRRRSRGLASRSWIPVALSFGMVILTAIALVIYFAAR
jgi:pSer/pThr/pTyr-binding forkhead associated (FHA) protein